jgi:hypothetical protein
MRLTGPNAAVDPMMRIVNAERFRDGSGLECVLLECGHRYIRKMPTAKDWQIKCLKEHDLFGRRFPWDKEYVSGTIA